MKAKEKKDIILQRLTKTTYNLDEDFSCSIKHIYFDWDEIHEESYRLTFFPNHSNCLSEGEVYTIMKISNALGCYCTIKVKHGVPVVTTIVDDDRR